MAFEVNEYPPRSFSEKYQKYLAPHGVLISPQKALKNKKLGNQAEDTLRKAFKITIKKLKKMKTSCANCNMNEGVSVECMWCQGVRYCSEECQKQRVTTHTPVCHLLRNETIDQVVECLPCPVPLGREVLKGKGGKVKDWDDWYSHHTNLGDSITNAAILVSQWWSYTGLQNPGEEALQHSLKRIVSNVFSTVLTIGNSVMWFPSLQHKPTDDSPFHIHLLGADKPEVGAVTTGLITVSSRVLGRPLVVTLVAPDLAHHPVTLPWTPTNPHQVAPSVSVVAYAGLYHDFWREHVATTDPTAKVRKPDLALAIHPGVHTDEMLMLWKPTLLLLTQEKIPTAMTTYNHAEYQQTLQKLSPLGLDIVHKGVNPLGSLHAKQTPYEPDHVWANNSYVIAIHNT
ncbi:hypothetical protein Pmani_016406 [Petrolisthes manimaculis]|uniref:MYND-type domain-containing protein n=1 Tax=Petrolisthes manimaculis TaxID=1843537 RepID=A0AAE1PQ38_9EUCA|nr:hypothetical protein Pmani_016406 [Petrolisthes manimaculis]